MKSEIFFVVTTIAVIVVTVGVSIVLFYIIRLLRRVDEVSEDVKEHITAFGSWIRGNVFVRRFFGEARKSRKKRATATAEE